VCSLFQRRHNISKHTKLNMKRSASLIIEVGKSEGEEFWFTWSLYWSSRLWIWNTESIHESRRVLYFEGDTTHLNTQTQTLSTEPVRHWGYFQWKNLLQIDSDSLFWGWIYYRSIQSYNPEKWTYYRSVQSPELEDKLINVLV
jgi:hypothetical protein